MSRLKLRGAFRALLCLCWIVGILFGVYKFSAYSRTPGDLGHQPRNWPSNTRVARTPDRPLMLVTLHPRCACSRASLQELRQLMAQVKVPVHVEVLVYQPINASDAWQETDTVKEARSIPGVTVRPDPGGMESERFNMSVSGHTVVYAPDGRLLFSGGITPARGEIGENAGRRAIAAILEHQQPATTVTKVFGCSIRDL